MQHDTLIIRQVVIAITLTPVRHKRYMQFLASGPNLGGGGKLIPANPAFPNTCLILMTRALKGGLKSPQTGTLFLFYFLCDWSDQRLKYRGLKRLKLPRTARANRKKRQNMSHFYFSTIRPLQLNEETVQNQNKWIPIRLKSTQSHDNLTY